MSPVTSFRAHFEQFVAWARKAEPVKVALAMVGLAFAVMFVLPLIVAVMVALLPLSLVVLLVVALFLFARAWLREFQYLIDLPDDVFQGHNDKLIWAILLIVLPPVGVMVFRSYRAVRWPQAKPWVETREVMD